MASSSVTSASQVPPWNYDVFLSFRGEDTRKTFVSHLYHALKISGIHTFLDDKRVEHGTSIPQELDKAIEESQVAVIILSKNFASSSWCLMELLKIMECKKQYGQIVIPVFYHVDPSEVRHQKGSFAKVLAEHESKYKDDDDGIEKVRRWRTSLNEVATIKGPDVCNNCDGIESEIILQIVDKISSSLRNVVLSSRKDIVGIDTHLEQVKSMLEMETDGVRMIGICGMGGIGKTTIARVFFDELSYQFDVVCFLSDIKENETRYQIHSLQNTLLSILLRKKDDYVNNKDEGKHMIACRLRSKKVLIVLDDVDHGDHLDYLAGDHGWFGKGSRIIVTSRNNHLLGKTDAIYEMTTLANRDAIQLFNQHAFKKEVPDKCFEKLILEVVSLAKGLPIALKVWGSYLHKRSIIEWRIAAKQMKNDFSFEIFKKLKISYDGLEPIEQEIFLDIACFLRGYEKHYVEEIVKSCHFGSTLGLSVLIEKSLVFISKEGRIDMHDLIQEMGRYVVTMQKDPAKRSRLWLKEDFVELMNNNMGSETMEAIWINCAMDHSINSKAALKNMKRLRILHILTRGKPIQFHGGSIEYLSNNLRWFCWDVYPLKSLPAKFEPKRLVHLALPRSSLHQLWMEKKYLTDLKSLDLSMSTSLMHAPDFTGMPNLEILKLSGCAYLEEVHHSLGYCKKLIMLDFSWCTRLKRLPSIFHTGSLKYLNLRHCNHLENCPEIPQSMNCLSELDMSGTGITKLPSFIGYLSALTELDLFSNVLVTLPSNICRLKNLKSLCLVKCSELKSLPEEIGDLESLEKLDARCTRISRPPPSITRLNKLKSLMFGAIVDEQLYIGESFVFPSVALGLLSLEILSLTYCNIVDGGLLEDIGSLSSLVELHLNGNNFDYLPQSITQLRCLRHLGLLRCKRLKEIPKLPPNCRRPGVYHSTYYQDYPPVWFIHGKNG